MQEPPTIAEELDRKALETLETTMHGLAVNKISLPQAHAAITTLWGTVAGLIPKDTMNLVAQAQTHIEQQLRAGGEFPHDFACLVAEGGAGVVIMRFADRVKLRTVFPGVNNGGARKEAIAAETEVQPGMWAAGKFQQWCSAFADRGYTRIF
jgi:hypothetical protein